MKNFMKLLFLFVVGGLIYVMIEMVFRGHSHPTMFVVGGLCFLICGDLNEIISWEMPFLAQMILGSIIITSVELIAGLILNVWLGLGIWDYSNMPFNYKGQICLPYSLLWCLLSGIGIVLDDYLRYWIFGEEKPHYTFWRKGKKC